MVVQGKTIVAVALAAWASSACGVGYYLGSDAGSSGAGSSAGNPASSAGVASPNESGETAPPSTSGIVSGFPGGSGVSTGEPAVTSGTTVFTSGSASSGTLVTPPPPPPPPPPADAQAFCKIPKINAGSLPFVVDTAFVPSGWMGDAPAYMAVPADPVTGAPAAAATTARMTLLPTGYTTIGDACTPDGIGRSSPTAKGACWKVIFVPFPKTIQPGSVPGTTKIGGGPGYGWAGAFWQYPRNNWGAIGGGYPIPPGATTVSFWARGHDGGEKVRFFTGEGLNTPCSDYVATTGVTVTFPTVPAWTRYTIDITGLDYSAADITPGQGPGGYFGGIMGAFAFGVGDQTLPTLDGGSAPPNETDPTRAPVADPAVPGALFPPFFGSTIQFYIDDIEFE